VEAEFLTRQRPIRSAVVAFVLSATMVFASAGASASGAARVHIARTISVQETAHLHLVSRKGATVLNESGEGRGTFKCPMSVQIINSYTTAKVSFSTCTKGGSISGRGAVGFYLSGSVSHFSGTVNITRGTGRYSRAAGRNLRLTGTLVRSNFSLSLTVTGKMSL
jgi:hypothetical protein